MVVPLIKHKDDELKIPESKNDFVPKPNFRWLIIGSSGSGKSNLIRYMLTNDNLFPSIFDEKHIFVMCPTCDMSKDYEFIPKQNVFDYYDESLLKEIIDSQKLLIKKYGKKEIHLYL